MKKMTIKAAKEMCREKFGRLPRCGYEMDVDSRVEEWDKESYPSWGTRTHVANVTTVLQNVSGTYRVRESWQTMYR